MEYIELAMSWWGSILIALALIVGSVFVWDRKTAKDWAWNLVVEVEKNARTYLLEDPDDKIQWVLAWYDFLPQTVRLFVSAKTWEILVRWAWKQISCLPETPKIQ